MTSSQQAYSGHKITSAVILTYKAHPLLHAPCRMWGNCSMLVGWTPTGSRGGGFPQHPPTKRPETHFGHPSARLDAFCQTKKRQGERERERERETWRREEVGSSLERLTYAWGNINIAWRTALSHSAVLFRLLLGNKTAMSIKHKLLNIFNEFHERARFEKLTVVHLSSLFIYPTDAQLNCSKRMSKLILNSN